MASMFNNQSTGVLQGLKERLGFGKNDAPYNQYNESLDDGYGEYEDAYGDGYDGYDDDGYDDAYDGQYSLGAGASGDAAHSGASSASSPRLITLDDVKASTSKMTSERYGTEQPASRKRITVSNNESYDKIVNSPAANVKRAAATSANNASATDATKANKASEFGVGGSASNARGAQGGGSGGSAAGVGGTSAASQKSHERSAGLNSLFTPSAGASSSQSRRSVNVVRPSTYNDVACVADMLRTGGVVVLYLAQTPESLQKRVLDFSFGVASALDAHVDSVGESAYAITCGEQLSAAERASLSSQGIS